MKLFPIERNSAVAQILYGLCILVLLVIVTFLRERSLSQFGIVDAKEKPIPYTLTFTVDTKIDAATEAKAYVVYDLITQKVIVGKNENTVYPLASMTKLMTAITAYELGKDKTLVTISPAAIEGTYDLGLQKGQLWKLGELIKYMLVYSSNDAAHQIALTLGGRATFVDTMNAIAKREGLQTLTFTNEDGTDTKDHYGGAGTPLEVARLMAYAYKKIPEALDPTTKPRANVKTQNGIISGVPNTNQSVEEYLGVSGSKTGFTDIAGGNLVIIFDIVVGRPVVIVVMGSSRDGRFTDTKKLYEIAKKAIQ